VGDPNGDIGVYIRFRSCSDYEDRCDEYGDKNEKLWAELDRSPGGGMTGDAKLLAMS
jgi:hypothetical protein